MTALEFGSSPLPYIGIEGPTLGLPQIRFALAATPNWQHSLLTPVKLGEFARKMGLGHFSAEQITGLWRIGLLRADVVRANTAINIAGLIAIDSHEANSFIDVRSIGRRDQGFGSAMEPDAYKDWPPIDLLFHPYRLYVLHHVDRTLEISTSSSQYLQWRPGVERVITCVTESLDRWTSSDAFSERFDYWNQVCEIALSCAATKLQSSTSTRQNLAAEHPPDAITGMIQQFILALGLQAINVSREELAWAASTHDANRTIHTLLRLMKKSEREKLEGKLGIAMKFLEMAEAVRRPVESLLGVQLPEEDELGPGQWMPDARKNMYGHARVFDAPRKDLRDFLGILGLDFGVKVRCYVEGPTELGALKHALGTEGPCSFINLAGQVAERRGKGVAFRESLANDMNARIFSVLVLDNDRSDFVRAVKLELEQKSLVGAVFLMDPDMELANFTMQELLGIAIRVSFSVHGEMLSPAAHGELLATVQKAKSADQFIQFLRAAGRHGVAKGEKWGQALMAYAIAHPAFPEGDRRAGTERPLISVANLLIRTWNVGFRRSQSYEEIDPQTGRVVKRKDVK